jgi:hypothetical protein
MDSSVGVPCLSVLMTNPGSARDAAAGARARGVCIMCGEVPRLRSESDLAEYRISAVCGPCWDGLFGGLGDE